MSSEESEKLLKDLLSKLNQIEDAIDAVKHHPSQNGGWKQLVDLIEKIDRRLEDLEDALNNPRSGAIAEVESMSRWRTRTSEEIKDFSESCIVTNNRLLSLEMQMSNYNKVTWAIGAGTIGLLVKAFMGLVIV